jgi:MerR family transcriptional regulator/heat shock protein HspR
MPRKSRNKAAFMISAVAESYSIHPQTLRLYEREGLLKPSRSEGNTRLYTERDLERLELILSLTRDMGVNLAGVEVVLNMRDKMEQMQHEMREFVSLVQREMMQHAGAAGGMKNALVRFVPRHAAPVRVKKGE